MSSHEKGNKLNFLNLLVVVLSVYVLLALITDTLFVLPRQTSRLLELIDNSICAVFLLDFLVRFFQARNKWKFMEWGWIDLVSSIPASPFLQFGRIFRLLRLFRILRAFRSVRHFVNYLFHNRAFGAITTMSAVTIIMVIFSAIAILQVEHAPNSNIKTAEDAIWWAWCTITAVGYGDVYPVTTEGRIIASMLMITGIALVGVFTGFVAAWFLRHKKPKEDITAEIDAVRREAEG
ncbi:MAG TPA: ion transporter [Puia sp.]|nr:ion transporter [Puia sp.]